MKTARSPERTRILLVITVLAAISGGLFLWVIVDPKRGVGDMSDSSLQRANGSEALAAPVPSPSNPSPTSSAARTPVEPAGEPTDLDPTWLPVRADVEIEGWSGEQVAAYFYGDEWSVVRAELERNGELGWIENVTGGEGRRFGDLEAILTSEVLTPAFLSVHDKAGRRNVEILAVEARLSPFQQGSAAALVREQLEALVGGARAESVDLATGVGADVVLATDAAARTTLAPLYEELDARVRDLLASQFTSVSTRQRPPLGHLHVAPIVSGGAREYKALRENADAKRWTRCYTAGSDLIAGTSCFAINWGLDLRTDSVAAQIIAAIESEESAIINGIVAAGVTEILALSGK